MHPFVNNLTVNHPALPKCKFTNLQSLNANIDSSFENFTKTMRDLENHTGINRFKNTHTREAILNIGKLSNHAAAFMSTDPLAFPTAAAPH